MGDAADDMFDLEMRKEFYEPDDCDCIDNGIFGDEKVWMTKDGRLLKISEMEDSHLINSYKMLQRNGFIQKSVWKDYLCAPYPEMSEAAQDAFDFEFTQILDKKPSVSMDWIYEEIQRRGLKYA